MLHECNLEGFRGKRNFHDRFDDSNGIIFINIYQLVELNAEHSELRYAVMRVLDAAVNHRFNAIFAFLFGVGFHLFLKGAEAKGKRPVLLYLRRMLLLLLMGALHHYFQSNRADSGDAAYCAFLLCAAIYSG